MAWFGDGLSSLSNLKGQITNFTKEVLSDGIVEEVDDRSRQLNEANEKCVELQELLNSKDAEIALLRRQNTELQKTVVDLNAKTSQPNDNLHNEDFFWDPPPTKTRESEAQNQMRVLQDQLAQATMKIRELETERKRFQKANGINSKDEITDNQQKTELLRAKQDMMNRIIQIGEKGREAERNVKRLQMDESALVNDFRMAISKLASPVQLDLIKSALLALESENDRLQAAAEGAEKSDIDEKTRKLSVDGFQVVSLKANQESKTSALKRLETEGFDNNREIELSKKIEELQEENKRLTTNIEELDRQHSESIDKILILKEELQKKHHSLQDAYERLYVDYNEAVNKLETLKNEHELSNTKPSCINTEDKATFLENDILVEKVKNILKNTPVDAIPGESIIESVARNYVDSMWKKEMLERRVTELSRELKQTAELKNAMQLEGEDMQNNIESLLIEIEHLKAYLPSIPEASEERVASLESETESLQEELKKLQAENQTMNKKNLELTAELHSIKETLKDQENLEAELRNTRQQLEIAKQQLDVDNNESAIMDLSRKLNDTLEENNELRKKIDVLRSVERQMQEQLNMFLEKCKGLDENIELIEELKLDLQNVRRELAASVANGKRLESNLFELKQVNNELVKKNETLCREKESAQLDNDLLNDIRKQLQIAVRERSDLEYDILNMRKELDLALGEAEKLNRENEKLIKENNDLVDQIATNQNESLDKIDLLSTEKALLEQEFAATKDEVAKDKIDLTEVHNKLQESQKRVVDLENALATAKAENDRLLEENVQLENRAKKLDVLEADFLLLRSKENELTNIQEQYSNLEDQIKGINDLEEKLLRSEEMRQQLEHELANLRSAPNKEDITEQMSLRNENEKLTAKLHSMIEKNAEATQMARETIESLSQLVREKDKEIEALKLSVSNSEELTSLRVEKEELVKLVQLKHNESLQYHSEIQRLTQLLNEQSSVMQNLLTKKDNDEEMLQEKEAQLLWAQNELQVVRQRLKNFEESSNEERCDIVEHSSLAAQLSVLSEKCNAIEAALIQEQTNNRVLQNQFNEVQNKEVNAAKELERLRTHLVEMEANYTEEALSSEAKIKELEAKLMQAEEKVKNSSTIYTSASIRANQQVETLQQQLALIIQQRDDIQNKLSAAEDKALACSASVTNLQLVLEQFQRDKEKDIELATEKIRHQLNDSHKKKEELMNEISNLKSQLAEAKECLQAASRLTEELEKKSERIEQLDQEVVRLTELVNSADERIEEANKSREGKVDKTLVKNLLLGYLSSSANDKSSVLRVFATVLDFNESEKDKVGLNNLAAKSSWFSNLLHTGTSATSKDDEASLSAAFIKFLENESNPKPQLPALPISNTPISKPGHSRQHSSSSTQSTLLLSNISLPTFPDFVPARNTATTIGPTLPS